MLFHTKNVRNISICMKYKTYFYKNFIIVKNIEHFFNRKSLRDIKIW